MSTVGRFGRPHTLAEYRELRKLEAERERGERIREGIEARRVTCRLCFRRSAGNVHNCIGCGASLH